MDDNGIKPDDIMCGEESAHRTHCIRCGTCCMKGGPSLHVRDAALFESGVLGKNHVYTLRKGEVVRNIDETLIILDHEILKVKMQSKAWTCMFYDDEQKGCRIYDHRPVECRALKCWDLRDFRETMATPHLQRKDLLNPEDGMIKIINAHEQRCAYEILESAAKRLEGPEVQEGAEKILDLLHYDHHMRSLLTERYNMDPNMTDFFFGRPLVTTIRMFGLRVKEEGNDFFLVPMLPSEGPDEIERK